MLNKLGETSKELTQNRKDIDELKNSIAMMKDADRAGGEAVQRAVDKGYENLDKQRKKLEDDRRKHDGIKPNPKDKAAVTKYNQEADRLDARKRALAAEVEALTKADKDPRAAKEYIRKKIVEFENAKQKLSVDQVNIEKLLSDQKNQFTAAFKGMVDRCQRLSRFGKSEDLRTTCGFLFDANNPHYKSLKGMGIDPNKIVGGHGSPYGGKATPFEPGPGKPQLGPDSPFDPGWGPGPGVPPIPKPVPIDPQTGQPIDDDDDNDDN